MGENIAKRQAAGWPSPFRHALVLLLLAAGIVSMVTAAFVSSTAATAATPSTALDNLALYVSRGQPIYYCQASWLRGPPATTTYCRAITDFTPFQNRASLLREGELIRVEFTRDALSISDLIQQWGRPVLAHDRERQVSLRWDLAAGLSGWMLWGDPYKLPGTASLVLEALGDSDSTGPD